jgi:HlyD family secretion protein
MAKAGVQTFAPSGQAKPASETQQWIDWLHKKSTLYIGGAIVLLAGAILWYVLSRPALPAGFAGGNGRLESNEIYVATKYPGRVKQVMFNEGDTVEAGQIVAIMDTSALEEQLRQAVAQITEAEDSFKVAQAQIAVKQAQYNFAAKQYDRSKQLVTTGAVSGQEAELDQANALSNRAELVGAQADATKAQAAIEAAKASADRLRAEISDAVLRAPMRTRIETRLAEPGEVLPQGGRVYSVNNLADVYMYVFMPESVTGKVKVGSEARIVLDAAKQYPIRAFVAFVSPMAQFTPKSVETAEERHNLTFRVKLQIDPKRLRQYEALVKSGLPGMGYVRYDQNAEWPAKLQVQNVNPQTLWTPTGSKSAN